MQFFGGPTPAGADSANTPNVNAGSTFYGYTDEGLVAEYASSGSGLSNGDMLAAYGYLPNQTWQTNPAYKRDVQTGTTNPDRIHLFHNDHLGSPQRLTDSEGKTSWSASFESFGRGYGDASSSTNVAVTSSTPAANNHRFPGQVFDGESGKHYNYFRDYDPQVGRYTESDPIGLRGGLSTYGYVGANPMGFRDPFGLQAIPVPGIPIPGVPSPWRPSPPGPISPEYPTVPGESPGWGWPSLPDWLSDIFALKSYTCEVRCNVQQIDKCAVCPDRVTGVGVSNTRPGACVAAQKDANSKVPRGCYKRHCHEI